MTHIMWSLCWIISKEGFSTLELVTFGARKVFVVGAISASEHIQQHLWPLASVLWMPGIPIVDCTSKTVSRHPPDPWGMRNHQFKNYYLQAKQQYKLLP